MTLEHHYEVVVPVDPPEDAWDESYGDDATPGWPGSGDKPWLRAEYGLPYLNQENSASWHQGTVFNEDTGDWENADDYDDEACRHLQDVLDLPQYIHRIYRRNTDEGPDGDWDIGILDEIAELLKNRFNIDVTREWNW